MTNLLNDDCALECGLLSVVSFELNTGLFVSDTVCCGRRVMADLFRNECRFSCFVRPSAEEQLAEERV